jgi:hypothetical protein
VSPVVRPQHLRAEPLAAGVRLRLRVDNVAGVMETYDRVVVATSLEKDGAYTDLGTTLSLDEDTHEYTYTDAAGTTDTWYRVRYSDGVAAQGEPTNPVRGNGGGNYATIEQVRDEDIAVGYADDARVLRALRSAEKWLEEITRRRFFPQQRTLRMDGNNVSMLPLRLPIVQIDGVKFVTSDWPTTPATAVDLNSVMVYNRHLTQDLHSENDRNFPRLEFPDGTRWISGRQNVRIQGWFNYTELGFDDEVGEISDGSQTPLSRGQVPPKITEAVVALTIRNLPKKGDADEVEWWNSRHRVSKFKTRHEEVQLLSPASAGGLIGRITGDSWLDGIITQYMAPAQGRMVG